METSDEHARQPQQDTAPEVNAGSGIYPSASELGISHHEILEEELESASYSPKPQGARTLGPEAPGAIASIPPVPTPPAAPAGQSSSSEFRPRAPPKKPVSSGRPAKPK
ncbi:hypothetical protein GLOTRDRAFT_140642 [Gloeophyllum trabeum ATCC 11539]|uniref:Uncharacterized protein n=1 Tax=Gloeophyllum trabeum (strain ATCC 11539 / FP-39264 / Madison 617) TaxID=670483 RepID=S7PY19_GLOTA|nr:uncharacterized protein GLOTRDRAFT_140642 [Gloeophyllum trabeum ATCC 11539]EPQ52247.1 hypothetical protein GLOTRDRAFT_140642 [Gloeophyllum trabeum ATCC 11539]